MDADDLSRHGRLILDYARQAAKRRGHGEVRPLHVALAMRLRSPDDAEKELGPELLARVEALAIAVQTSHQTPVAMAQTIELVSHMSPGEEWRVLREELPALLDAEGGADSQEGDGGRDASTGPEESSPRPGPSTESPDRPAEPQLLTALHEPLEQFLRDLRPAVASLAGQVGPLAPTRWSAPEEVDHLLLDDLWSLFSRMALADATVSEGELRVIHDFFEQRAVPGITLDPAADIGPVGAASRLFDALRALDRDNGGHEAKRYAHAVLHVASHIASACDEVSLEEAQDLDRLRVGFREALLIGGGTAQPVLAGDETTTAAMRALDELVGLASVKQEIRSFVDLTCLNKLRRERGHPSRPPTMHMVFIGNPGTGKTTVARLLGQILASLNLLSQGHFLEVDRAALIGEYVGHTAPQVHKLVNEARGGVLFIDEAYSLTPSSQGGGYEREAIDTLVKMMEDLRHDLVVIAAGYPELMAGFLDANPGLRGRFAIELFFPDHTIDELMAIFDSFVTEQRRTCSPDARSQVRRILDLMRRRPGFGNGRDVRNLFEMVERRQAERLMPFGEFVTDDDLITFVREDVPVIADEPQDGRYL